MKLEFDIIDGFLWERWHYPNGQLECEFPYNNGELHGFYRSWYENGQLAYEVLFVDGKFHGLRRCWHTNGQLRYVELWNNRRLVFKAYNPPQTSGKWKLK